MVAVKVGQCSEWYGNGCLKFGKFRTRNQASIVLYTRFGLGKLALRSSNTKGVFHEGTDKT